MELIQNFINENEVMMVVISSIHHAYALFFCGFINQRTKENGEAIIGQFL